MGRVLIGFCASRAGCGAVFLGAERPQRDPNIPAKSPMFAIGADARQHSATNLGPLLHVCIHSSCLALGRGKSRLRRDCPDRHRCTVVRCTFRPAFTPEGIEEIHWATGINKQAVLATCWNALETVDELSFDTVRPLLLEEYPPEDIDAFRPHIDDCTAVHEERDAARLRSPRGRDSVTE